MPELKRNFMKGRMNKDLDERLIPDGEYRDALNIEVSTAESSDVGTARNVSGNYSLSTIRFLEPFWSGSGGGNNFLLEGESGQSQNPFQSFAPLGFSSGTEYSETCSVVGAIADTERDSLFAFVKDCLTLDAQPAGTGSAAGATAAIATANVNGATTDSRTLVIDTVVQVSGAVAVGLVVTGTDVVYGTTISAWNTTTGTITLSTKNTLANDTALSFSTAAYVGVITEAILEVTPKSFTASSPTETTSVAVFVDTHTAQRIPWKPIEAYTNQLLEGSEILPRNISGFENNPYTTTIFLQKQLPVSSTSQMNFSNGVEKGARVKAMLDGVDLFEGVNNGVLTEEPLGQVHVDDIYHTNTTTLGGVIYAQIFITLNKAIPDDIITASNIAAGLVWRFENEKLLELEAGEYLDYTETSSTTTSIINDSTPIDTKITGINMIDGTIYWTDGRNEPKRVDVEKGILGSNTIINAELLAAGTNNVPQYNINLHRTTRMKYENPISHQFGAPHPQYDPTVIDGFNTKKEKPYEYEDVTVIRRYPLNPPDIEMKRSSRVGVTHQIGLVSTANHITATTPALNAEVTFNLARNHVGDWRIPSYYQVPSGTDANAVNNEPSGVTRTTHTDYVGDEANPFRNHSWRIGDKLRLYSQWMSSTSGGVGTHTGSDMRHCVIQITEITSQKPSSWSGTGGPRVKNNKREEDIIYYDPSDGFPEMAYGSGSNGTTNKYNDIISIKGDLISRSDALTNVSLSGAGCTVGQAAGGNDWDIWTADLLEESKALYEDKFARFAYRYKYEDGQRSAMSPFTNPAFLPKTRFGWEFKEGNNTAMVNDARVITVKNFIDSSTPEDVKSIDILVKFDGENSIYFLKNIEKGSREWNNDDDNWIKTLFGPGEYNAVTNRWKPPYPNLSASNKRGLLKMTAELNGNVIPSNQILRPFDNVPRKAKAQCVAGSRLIYGNYTLDYPMEDADGKAVEPRLIASWRDPDDINYKTTGVRKYASTFNGTNDGTIRDSRNPMPSIKSSRTYTIGVAFLDRFGRQSPVMLAPESSFICNSLRAPEKIKLKAKLDSKIGNYPYWATDYKFYIKETSNEYYNLALFAAYPAVGEGVAEASQTQEYWLSFSSSDRNKIQEDSIIRLKTARGGWGGFARHNIELRVLDISNEAPLSATPGSLGGGTGTVVGAVNDLATNIVIDPKHKKGKFFVRVKATEKLMSALGKWAPTAGTPVFGGTMLPGPHHSPIFETLPDPDVGLNIFYEVPKTYPIQLDNKNIDSFIQPGDYVYAFRTGYNKDATDATAPTFDANDTDGNTGAGAADLVNVNGSKLSPSDCFVLYDGRINDILDDLRVKVKAVRGSNVKGGIQRIQLDQVVNFGMPVELHSDGFSGWIPGSDWVGLGTPAVTIGTTNGYPSNSVITNYTGLNEDNAATTGSHSKFGSFHVMRPDGSKVHATICNLNDVRLSNPSRLPKLGIGYADPYNYLGKNQPYYSTDTIEIFSEVLSSDTLLPWFNCWAFGNSTESDRIRDDFNAPKLDNGVKASTTAPRYGEKNLKHGMIFSGIYNSKNGVNNLNQFITAEGIIKDLNPEYGSIQKLFTRDTDILAFCENKVLKVLANKDALFNADGNTNLTSVKSVLGTAIPFRGDHGISRNPESFAEDEFRCYFTDRDRGAVCRLSMDGVTAISDIGMHDWFKDNLKSAVAMVGAFNDEKGEYDVTIHNNRGKDDTDVDATVDVTKQVYTLSFNEKTNSWVSFKSYVLDYGLSLNNDYYTFKQGEVWHHAAENITTDVAIPRNNWYDTQFFSTVTPVFNDAPGSTKSFQTINYEGSQANVLTNHRTGTTSGTHSNTTTLNLATSVTGLTVGQVVTGNDFTAPSDFNSPSGDDITVTAINAAGTQLTLSQAVSIASAKSVVFSDTQYYNDDAYTGWYVESITTDKQTGKVLEFKEKEGKWFNNIQGDCTTFTNTVGGGGGTGNIDSQEFSLQGIAVSSGVSGGSGSGLYISTNVTGVLAGSCASNVTVTSSSELLIPSASNLGTYDFTVTGDETQTFTVCPNDGYILDTIAVASVTIGGSVVTVGSGSEIQSVTVTNPDYSSDANLVSASMSTQSSPTNQITCASVVLTWKAGYQPTANQTVIVNLTGNVYQATFNQSIGLFISPPQGTGWTSSTPVNMSSNWNIGGGEVGGTIPDPINGTGEFEEGGNYVYYPISGLALSTNNSYDIAQFQYTTYSEAYFPNSNTTNTVLQTALASFINPDVWDSDSTPLTADQLLGTPQTWNGITVNMIDYPMAQFQVSPAQCVQYSFFVYWYASSYNPSGFSTEITVGIGINYETDTLSCLPGCGEDPTGITTTGSWNPLIHFKPIESIGGDEGTHDDIPDDPVDESTEQYTQRKHVVTINIQHDDTYGGSVTSTGIDLTSYTNSHEEGEVIGYPTSHQLIMSAQEGFSFVEASISHVLANADVAPSGGVATYIDGDGATLPAGVHQVTCQDATILGANVVLVNVVLDTQAITDDLAFTIPIAGAAGNIKTGTAYTLRTKTMVPVKIQAPEVVSVEEDPGDAGGGYDKWTTMTAGSGFSVGSGPVNIPAVPPAGKPSVTTIHTGTTDITTQHTVGTLLFQTIQGYRWATLPDFDLLNNTGYIFDAAFLSPYAADASYTTADWLNNHMQPSGVNPAFWIIKAINCDNPELYELSWATATTGSNATIQESITLTIKFTGDGVVHADSMLIDLNMHNRFLALPYDSELLV